MDLAKKLNVKSGHLVIVENAPEGFVLELPDEARLVQPDESPDAVLVFVRNSSELGELDRSFVDAARRDATCADV